MIKLSELDKPREKLCGAPRSNGEVRERRIKVDAEVRARFCEAQSWPMKVDPSNILWNVTASIYTVDLRDK